ncbi:MAG: hypothetical protein ACI81P_000881 [Neolewinella sp.]|jgi:hypothetical protein
MKTHYEPSDNIDVARTAIGAAIAFAIIVGLSFLYNAIISVIPIIYLSVVAPIGYGVLLGLMSRVVIHLGKFRSRKKGVVLALLFGLAANYTQWFAYLDFVYVQDFQVHFASYLNALFGGFGLGEALGGVAEINEYGTWSIGASGENPVNGVLLTIIWVLEFLIILLYPAWTLRKKRSRPFSENQDRFYDQFILENLFQALYTSTKAEHGMAEDPLSYLKGIALTSRYPGSRVEVYFLPDENAAYVSILRTRIDEKQNEISMPVVNEFRVKSRDAKRILDAFPHAKDGFNVFID